MTSPTAAPQTIEPDEAAVSRYLMQQLTQTISEAANAHGAVQRLAQERAALTQERDLALAELAQLRVEFEQVQQDLARTRFVEDQMVTDPATQAP